MVAITLAVGLVAVSCTPVERTAYRIISSSKGFLDSEKAAHPECAVVSGAALTKVCASLAVATSAKDLLIDAAEVYCASPSFSVGNGICTPPAKGTPAFQQASDRLRAAITNYEQSEKDLKGLVK